MRFRAMNTDVTVVAGAGVCAQVARVFAAAEQRFSRFREDSELSLLNRAHGPTVVSHEMFAALVAARRHVEQTGGLFEPAIGGVLVALGYDRSFAPGALDRDANGEVPPLGSFLDVKLDAEHRAVTLPRGMQIDLGGMIKGRTVDEAARWLPARGAIDAGGDAMVRGEGLIDVEDPRDAARIIMTIRVRDRAVATSASNRRRWRVARAVRHHLVDPRARASAQTDLLQATVFAPTAEEADVLAKTAFLLGAGAARALIARRPELGAVLVPAAGAPIVCGELEVVS